MPLTAAQKTALKAHILATSDLNAIYEIGDLTSLADALNTAASPAFIVWRTDLPTKDVKKAIVWTEYISSTSQAERDALDILISNGIVNAADANVRAGFTDIFSGPQKVNTRNALIAIAKRSASRAEKLFAAGTGTDQSPATLVFEGSVSFGDLIGL